ncbi:MAG: hypothetical protein ACK5WZ_04020 [Pseudobdellovibrionaceae bacterium]
MKNASAALLVIVMLGAGIYFFWYNSKQILNSKVQGTEFLENTDDSIVSSEEPSDLAQQAGAPEDKSVDNSTSLVEPSQGMQQVQEVPSVSLAEFSIQLKSCLGVPPSTTESATTDLNQSVLMNSMSGLGEAVLRSEDWSEKDILSSDGKKKRIRIEVNLQEEENLGLQRLQYSEVLENGQLKEISLNQDQSIEPDRNLIASLESEGQIVRESKKERAYFPGGEEVVFGSVNGQIKNIEIHRFDMTLKCDGPQCSCTTNRAQFDDEGVRPTLPPSEPVTTVEDKSKLRANAEFQQSQIPTAGSDSKNPVRK